MTEYGEYTSLASLDVHGERDHRWNRKKEKKISPLSPPTDFVVYTF